MQQLRQAAPRRIEAASRNRAAPAACSGPALARLQRTGHCPCSSVCLSSRQLRLKELVVSAGGDRGARGLGAVHQCLRRSTTRGRFDRRRVRALPDCSPHPGVALSLRERAAPLYPQRQAQAYPRCFAVLRCHHGAAPRRLHASMRQSSVATAAALSRVPCSTGDFNLGKSQPLRYESEALDLFNNVFNGPQNTQVPKMTSKKSKFV